MEITFNSEEELYKRLIPALTTKKEEMNRKGFSYIKEEDIWNYFKEVKWRRANGLELHEMVDDILNCDDIVIDSYLKTKLNMKNRKLYFNDESRR